MRSSLKRLCPRCGATRSKMSAKAEACYGCGLFWFRGAERDSPWGGPFSLWPRSDRKDLSGCLVLAEKGRVATIAERKQEDEP